MDSGIFRKIYIAVISFFRKSWRVFWGKPINAKAARLERREKRTKTLEAELFGKPTIPFDWSDEPIKLVQKKTQPESQTAKKTVKGPAVYSVDSVGVPIVILDTKNGRRAFPYCEHKRAIRPGYPCVMCTTKPCSHGWYASKDRPCLKCVGGACEHNWVPINGKKCGACSLRPKAKGPESLPLNVPDAMKRDVEPVKPLVDVEKASEVSGRNVNSNKFSSLPEIQI
jgi:hypothetical protein